MKNKQLRVLRESIPLMKLQNEQIFQYSNQWGNHTIICARYIDFNKNIVNHDRAGMAYCTSFTPDSCYAVIFVRDPFSIQILNLKSGEIFVARGFNQFFDYKVLSVSVQPEEGIKAGHNTRNINVIFEYRGSIHFKIIQMSPKVDNEPKSRNKVIQQNQIYKTNAVQCCPVFSTFNWNNFIYCRKQMRVCKALKKNDQITFNFAVQAFQNQLNKLYSSFNIVAIAQTTQTWAMLCGNLLESKNNDNMTLNIFWQHQQDNQLSRNMYFRDDSFIKSIDIPTTEKQFVKCWTVKSFYLIQVKGRNEGSRKLYVIPEQLDYGMTTLDLSYNSDICYHSLTVKANELSICQIVNKNQLVMIKLSQNQSQLANTTHSNSTSISQQQTQTNKVRTQNRTEIKQTSITVKQFITVQEQKTITTETQKNTVKKSDTVVQGPKIEQTKKLINEKIVQHLTKVQKGAQQSLQSQQLQVPNQLENLISFGASNTQSRQINSPNEPAKQIIHTNKNQTLLSFGTPQVIAAKTNQNNSKPAAEKANQKSSQQIQKKIQAQNLKQAPIEKNKNANIVQKIQKFKVSKKQSKQLLQFTELFLKNISEQFNLRHTQLLKNYSQQTINQNIKFQPVFTKQQQKKLSYFIKLFEDFQFKIKKKIMENQMLKKLQSEKYINIFSIIQSSQKLLIMLKINMNKDLPQVQNLRRFIKLKAKKKTFQQQILDDLSQIKGRVEQITGKSDELLKKYLFDGKTKKTSLRQQKKSLGLKQITQILNKSKQKLGVNKQMRIPIPRILFVNAKDPIIRLSNI